MNFDKSKIIKQDNKNIYANKIDTDETLIFDEEYIFLDSIKTTKDIKNGAELLGLKLLDHVIIGDGNYKSILTLA